MDEFTLEAKSSIFDWLYYNLQTDIIRETLIAWFSLQIVHIVVRTSTVPLEIIESLNSFLSSLEIIATANPSRRNWGMNRDERFWMERLSNHAIMLIW